MDLRNEAMLMLEKRGAVLETARAVSRILRDNKVPGAVIGGVAVVLHGHVRTTRDVDVLIQQPLDSMRPLLEAHSFEFHPANREFTLEGVPVYLVPQSMVTPQPTEFVEIEQITTLRLPDLISIKLHSGSKNIARAQDIADVVGLIRQHNLAAAFASQIDPPMRNEFRKLVKAVRKS